MPKLEWIFAASAAVAFGCAIALLAREVAPKVLAPRIAASKQTVEFGQLGQGQEEATYVTLENRGRSDLAINSIHVTCGCTKVSLDKPRVPAGESAKLTITAGNGLGIAQRHRITVYSNDSVHPELAIDVMIAAVSRIGFQPSGIDFGRREKAHLPATEMLALQLDRTAPVKLEGVAASTDLPYVACEIIGWSEADRRLPCLSRWVRMRPPEKCRAG